MATRTLALLMLLCLIQGSFQLNCAQVEQNQRVYRDDIADQLENYFSGDSRRHLVDAAALIEAGVKVGTFVYDLFSNGVFERSLRIGEVTRMSFSGCNVNIRMYAKFKRFRRDGKGHVDFKGIVSHLDMNLKQICFGNFEMTDLKLSRTSRRREKKLRDDARKKVIRDPCFTF